MEKNNNTATATITKTKQQIAEEYRIHRNTLCRRLKALGIEIPRGLLYPVQVQKIYQALGHPEGQNDFNNT